ncbi:MAG TPA: DNA alkylation repair protein [Alphaproteobacteria bacterium]|jgi:3-methyladenine DNA glycosylase AlkD|nr:DNA alkylation repair protein [Alphaproteobacteria bacterium]
MTVKTPTATEALTALEAAADPVRAAGSMRYFKTGPGEYGEGDLFIGVTVPAQRKLARDFRSTPLDQAEILLNDKVHEARSLALMILVLRYERGDEAERQRIFELYVKNLDRIDNWDLVDGSAPYIVGPHLLNRDRALLDELVASPVIWRRRVAVLATWHFIRAGELEPTLAFCDRLIQDRHDLMHKACGWMLREAMKRNQRQVEDWLVARTPGIPRTTLRYAIERLPPERRAWYLALK